MNKRHLTLAVSPDDVRDNRNDGRVVVFEENTTALSTAALLIESTALVDVSDQGSDDHLFTGKVVAVDQTHGIIIFARV